MAALAIPLVELTSMLAEHRRSVMTKKNHQRSLPCAFIFLTLSLRLHHKSQNLHQTSALRLRTAKAINSEDANSRQSLSTGVPYA